MQRSKNLKRQRANAKADLAKAEAYLNIANRSIVNAYHCMIRIALNKGVDCVTRRNASRCCQNFGRFIKSFSKMA